MIDEFIKLSEEHGWKVKDQQTNIGMISFCRNGERINIYYTRKGCARSSFTVATCINHPKKGKTQLFRRGVDIEMLGRLFKKPRLHTEKGYCKRKNQ